jgi:hypothetical protein
VNWSEMEAVIENVDRLDSLVRVHNAGVCRELFYLCYIHLTRQTMIKRRNT